MKTLFPGPKVQLMARLPKGLHAELTAAAKASGWSLNAEIIRRLQEDIEAPKTAALVERAVFKAFDDAILRALAKEAITEQSIGLTGTTPAMQEG